MELKIKEIDYLFNAQILLAIASLPTIKVPLISIMTPFNDISIYSTLRFFHLWLPSWILEDPAIFVCTRKLKEGPRRLKDIRKTSWKIFENGTLDTHLRYLKAREITKAFYSLNAMIMKSSSSYSRIRLILNLLPIISFNLGFPSQTLKFPEDRSGSESYHPYSSFTISHDHPH